MLLNRRIDRLRRTRGSNRRAFSLAEVISALTLTAMMAAVSARSFHSAPIGTIQNAVDSQTIALELSRLRRLAIQNGESHGLRFVMRKGKVVGYDACKWTDERKLVPIEATRLFSDDTTVRPDHSLIEFNREGGAEQALTVRIDASKRRWEITVIPVTATLGLREIHES